MTPRAPRPQPTQFGRSLRRYLSTALPRCAQFADAGAESCAQHDARSVLAIADLLVASGGFANRFMACELIAEHATAHALLTSSRLKRLGGGMSSWGEVDVFACYVSGRAWRNGQVSDTEIEKWARSRDVWWRRAALVSTVPLNQKSRGGTGDVRRTLERVIRQ